MPSRIPTHKPGHYADARPSAAKRGYGRAWRTIRAAKIRADPYCEYCAERIEAEGKTGIEGPALACDVDHVDGDTRNVSAGNLRSTCRRCHNRKTHGTTRHDLTVDTTGHDKT